MDIQKMQLLDWLDDLCVRFIINLPQEELGSVERICFQVEEAQWFYEDFVRPLDPSLPSLNLKSFCMVIFQHCPMLAQYSPAHHLAAFDEFLAYKIRVPVRGAIMLNDAMTDVVLVKGWKKGARWSFPRGKINKDESDLDCAIREVYEETGFNLRDAGLADDESQLKSIDVSMREQHMQLFVFRGVPMDAHFEPKTRKEISKIDWYKLAELPTLKQARAQQNGDGRAPDLHQGNKFYMVAPFLAPLKQWIKQQRKRDRLGMSGTTISAMPTDDERVQDKAVSDVESVLARADPRSEAIQLVVDGNSHIGRLLAGLRASSQPAEPSADAPSQLADRADALKRILSVGQAAAAPAAPPPTEQPTPIPPNPLLAMLRTSSSQAPQLQVPRQPPPHTPFEQVTSSAPQPRTPPHHNHVRPPHIPQGARPPVFPYSPQQQPQFPPPRPKQAQQPSVPQLPSKKQPQGNVSQLLSLFRGTVQEDSFAPMPPIAQQGPGRPPSQQAFGPQGPSIVPPASKLPPPKLNAHTMSLLNAFKSPSQLPASPVNPGLVSEVSELSGADVPTISPPHASTHNSMQFNQRAAEPASDQAPKPASTHQSNLLNLFKSPAAPVHARRSGAALEPVELAAQASPHANAESVEEQRTKPPLGLQTTSLPRPSRSELTSATVTGPLHSPNFDYLRNQQLQQPHLHANGHSYGKQHELADNHTSQMHRLPLDLAKPSWPQNAPEVTRQVEAPQPVSYSILQRPNVLDHPHAQFASPTHDSSFDKRGSQSQEQQNALLSLFGAPTSASPKAVAPSRPDVGSKITRAPGGVAAAAEAANPRPRFGATSGQQRGLSLKPASGITSPVSPLPGSGKSLVSAQDSPSAMEARSRISSIGSLAGAGPNPPAPVSLATTSATVTPTMSSQPQPLHKILGPVGLPPRLAGGGADGGRKAGRLAHDGLLERRGGAPGRGLASPTTPADRSALLGFLEGVVRSAER